MSKASRLPATSARDREENLAILLREPFRAITEQLMHRFAEQGHPAVTFAHGNVFQFLDDGGTRIGVLAQRAGISKQAMAQLVAQLEGHGYLERAPDPDDRRATLIRATPRGNAVFAIAREFMADVEARVRERLGDRDAATLRRLLRELDATVGGIEAR